MTKASAAPPPLKSARWRGGEAAAERLVRRGYLSAREVLRKRRTRTQKILAWNRPDAAGR